MYRLNTFTKTLHTWKCLYFMSSPSRWERVILMAEIMAGASEWQGQEKSSVMFSCSLGTYCYTQHPWAGDDILIPGLNYLTLWLQWGCDLSKWLDLLHIVMVQVEFEQAWEKAPSMLEDGCKKSTKFYFSKTICHNISKTENVLKLVQIIWNSNIYEVPSS